MSDNLLPSRVRNNLECESENIPTIEPYMVYEKIKEMNIPDLVVPGDFPPRIWKLFAVELSGPVSIIANKILRCGERPVEWKMDFVTVIEKERDPQSKEQLRNISLTLFISKLVENLI